MLPTTDHQQNWYCPKNTETLFTGCVTHELVLKGYDNGKTYVRDPYNAANNGWYPVDYLFGVKSVDPTDNTEGSPFIAIKG